MDSLKDLIEARNKKVHDARDILAREKAGEKLGADIVAQADGLLDEAGALDARIEERQRGDARASKLSVLEDRMREPARRTTAPSDPGSAPPRVENGKALAIQWGRHALSLKPGTGEYERAGEGYAKRFAAYLRGDYHGRDGHESLGLTVGDNSKGGYAVPTAMAAGLVKFLDNMVFMRSLGTVLPPTSAKSVGVLSYDTDYADADWTAEVPASAISEDDAARFGKREMIPHQLTKLAKVSRKILKGSTLDLEAFVNERFAYKFAITEEQAFLTGSGVQQPLGVFTASSDGVTTSQDITCASSSVFTADEVINVLYDLKGPYIAAATWLASREFIKRCRKLKDSNNQYLWQAGLAQGLPGTILDRPYVMSEYVPQTYTTGLYVAAVGDLSHYWIQDGFGYEMQRLDELLALTNQVGLIARKETDGMPVLAEAFRRLKLG